MPSITPDLRMAGERSAAGPVGGSECFSGAGSSRGRGGGAGASTLTSRLAGSPAGGADRPSGQTTSNNFSFGGSPGGVTRGICSDRGTGRCSAWPLLRLGDQTLGSNAGSAMGRGGIAGRGGRGDSGASSGTSIIDGSPADLGLARSQCSGPLSSTVGGMRGSAGRGSGIRGSVASGGCGGTGGRAAAGVRRAVGGTKASP